MKQQTISTSLRLPQALYKELRLAAFKKKISMNAEILLRIESYKKVEDPENLKDALDFMTRLP